MRRERYVYKKYVFQMIERGKYSNTKYNIRRIRSGQYVKKTKTKKTRSIGRGPNLVWKLIIQKSGEGKSMITNILE